MSDSNTDIGGGVESDGAEKHQAKVETAAPASFVELDPLLISLGSNGNSQHLRFRASLEVVPGYETEVANVTPRVIDVLNAYLRAVELSMLENPKALIKLRSQMLRRIQLVTGDGRVRDLLILEFVLS